MANPKLIVHGGAWNIPDELDAAHLAGVERAVAEVFWQMKDGLSALDAVEMAVKILEEDPTFDSGRGAFLNELGEIELDAMIMNGQNLGYGAVAAVQNLLHPVSLARAVMEKTEHCLLVGAGAQRFAQKMGFVELHPTALLTDRELDFFEKIKDKTDFKTHHPFENPLKKAPSDTVGAVAFDIFGNLAAATSTGGTPRKMAGRVGDSPIAGAGAYADNESGAASSTGWGEAIMKVLLTKRFADNCLIMNALEASEASINYLFRRVENGFGGLVGIDRFGNYGHAFNTPKMARAWAESDGKVVAKILT